LGATSGDTGSAAEYALRGKRGIRVFMLSPYGKMSPFQTAQMYSLADANIFNIAIDGVFDDCQDIVKSIAADAAFKRRFHLGAVNSINWARIAAQVVYYFKGYFEATSGDDEQVCFAVPSGNFGNVLAGHVARRMGLPIRRLIVGPEAEGVFTLFGIAFFLIGVALIGLGVVGEYVGRIYEQVRQRPRYMVAAVLEQGEHGATERLAQAGAVQLPAPLTPAVRVRGASE